MNRFIKAGISLATVAAIAASASAVASATEYMGDVNDDGVVNSVDALTMLRYSVGMDGVEINLKKADINGDGEVNSADALTALRMSVNLADLIEYKEDKEDEKTPVDFDKAEAVKYYNDALKKAYANEKVTINKKTDINVKLDTFKPSLLLGTVNGLIKDLAVPTDDTKTFEANPTEAQKFLVPTDLEADGVKDYKIEKTDKGYKVVITIVGEVVDYKTMPKYNAQASLPIAGIKEMADKYSVTVNSSKLNYSGTVLTAEIDADGSILSLNHTMPLAVEAKAKYGFNNIEGSGSGQYTLDATFTY